MLQEINKTGLTRKNDFVEIKFTGYANGEIFDSNIEEDFQKLSSQGEPEKIIVIIGQGMLVHGFDGSLEGKELNKEYEISLSPKEGFGERKRELIKTIPLNSFTEQKVMPRPGMVLTLDNYLVKILAVSSARVIADFNNPLAGKKIKYKFTITRKVEDEKEKVETVLKLLFKFVPEFEITEKEVIVKGQKNLEMFVKITADKFKEFIGKELVFEEVKEEKMIEKKLKSEENKQEMQKEAIKNSESEENVQGIKPSKNKIPSESYAHTNPFT